MGSVAYSEWKFFGLNLWQQVLLGMVFGVIVGFLLGGEPLSISIFGFILLIKAASFKVLGVIFFKLIKMVVAPLIFFALIAGITSLTEAHHFKKIVIKGVFGYLMTAMIAVSLGLVLASIFQPGVGVSPPPISHESNISPTPSTGTPPTIGDFLMDLIPHNIVSAMANDMYLQIVVFAIFTGIVMNNIRANTSGVKELNAELCHITFKMIEWVIRVAPLAVFGFLVAMVGTTGTEVLWSLFRLVVLVISACVLQYLFFGFLIWFFARLSPFPFYRKMIPTQLMAFSTSSSKATLTTAMRELQDKMGVSMSTSNFMMPLGACINMDGTAIYLGIVSVFFAQMYGINLELIDYFMLLLTCTLGSIGAAGIPSGSIIFMGMVLTSVGIPMEGVAMILGVDRILDMFRTTVNITGDAAITLIVDKTENGLDLNLYNS